MPNKSKGGPAPSLRPEMPTRFRCKVGKEWKDLDAFSQSQQKLLQRSNGKIDSAHSGMTCRDHTSKARLELRCDLCGLIKSRDQFSKSSLKNEDYKCIRCTAWTETQEPSVTPAPLETGHISAEEEHTGVWQEGFVDSADFFEVEGLPNVPITSLQALNLNVDSESSPAAAKALSTILGEASKNARIQADNVSVSGESVASSTIPPHLAARMQAGRSMANSVSGASSVTGDSRCTDDLPPHLRLARTRESQRSETDSVSTATTVQEAKKSRQIPFNAWDPSGKQHRGFKSPTEGSSMSSAASVTSASNNGADSKSSVSNDPYLIGDWSADTAPAELDPEEAKNIKSSKWPKSAAVRFSQSELKKQPMLTHINSKHIDPAVDKQRRMNYCDSDDSDYE